MKNEKLRKFLPWIMAATLSSVLNLWVNFGGEKVNAYFSKFSSELLPNLAYAKEFLWVFIAITLLIICKMIESYEPDADELSGKDRLNLLVELEKQYRKQHLIKMDDGVIYKLDLKLNFSNESTPEHMREKFLDLKDIDLENFESLTHLYSKRLKRLMIVAGPGSGKSVYLLSFALSLLKAAKIDSNHPIPVIFDMSLFYAGIESFEHGYAPNKHQKSKAFLENWLVLNLKEKLNESGLDSRKAKKLFKEHKILFLFDGLDEIDHFLYETISNFLENIYNIVEGIRLKRDGGYPELIICCRKDEYTTALLAYKPRHIPAHAIVDIEPINDLSHVLEKSARNDPNGPAQKLIGLVGEHTRLHEIINSAFYVHIALKLIRDEINISAIESQYHLLDTYINFQLKVSESEYRTTDVKRYFKNTEEYLIGFSNNPVFSSRKLSSTQLESNIWSGILISFASLAIVAPFFYLIYFLLTLNISFHADKNIKSPALLIFLTILFFSIYTNQKSSRNYRLADLIPRSLFRPGLENVATLLFGLLILGPLNYMGLAYTIAFTICQYLSWIYLYHYDELKTSIKEMEKEWISIMVSVVRDFLGFVFLLLTLSLLLLNTSIKAFNFAVLEDLVTFLKLSGDEKWILLLQISILLSITTNLTKGTILNRFLTITVLYLKKKLPFKLNHFYKQMKNSGLLIVVNGAYKFRHMLIREYFKKQVRDEQDLNLVIKNGEIIGISED